MSVITAPASDCAKFAAGSLPRLTRLAATSVSGLITKVDPATFDYWVRVSPSASGLTRLTVTETTSGASVTLNPNGGVVLAQSGGSAAACAPVTSSVTYGSGPTTVTFDVAPATTYYVEVVYSALALVGQRPGSAAIIASVTTTGVAGSGAEVSVVGG